jgi:hypothetical protein
LLRENSEHIDDNGFTTSVVKALPRRREGVWLRRWLLAGGITAGVAAFLVFGPTAEILAAIIQFCSGQSLPALLLEIGLLTAGAVMVWGFSELLKAND